MPRRTRIPVAIGAAVLGLTLAACTGDDDTTDTTAPDTGVVETVEPSSDPQTPAGDSADTDGLLRIGLLLPSSGSGAEFGTKLRIAALTAVEEINVAGGVLGVPVEIISADEGESPVSAQSAVSSLIDRDVDAVVGPASSNLTLATLNELTSNGIVTCSPTASALALEQFPDDGYFFRTIPSDRMSAAAIAQVAGQTGARNVTIVYLDDDYGRPIAQLVAGFADADGLAVIDQIPFTADDVTFSDQIDQIAAGDPGVIVLIANAEAGGRMLSAMGDSSIGEDAVPVVVNEPLRHPLPADTVAQLPADMRENLRGVSQLARTIDSATEPKGAFATNAQDCVNLFALAAVQANSTRAADLAELIPAVSDSGVGCTTFVTCQATLADGLNVDYNGLGGTVKMNTEGDTVRGRFDVFSFEDGVDTSERQFVIDL